MHPSTQSCDQKKAVPPRWTSYCLAIGTLLFIFAPLLPNLYLPWVNFQSEFLACVGLLCLSIYTISLKSLYVPNSALFILAIALIPFFQYTFGLISFFGDAVIASMYLAGLSVAIIVGTNLNNTRPSNLIYIFASACLISALLSSFTAFYQWLDLSYLNVWVIDLRPGGRPYGNLGQPNHLALLVSFGLASTVYLYESKVFGAITGSLVSLVLVLCLVLTASKTPWLILFVFCCWWCLKRKTLKLTLGTVHIIGWIALYLLLRQYIPYFTSAIFPETTSVVREVAAGVRPVIWQQLFDAVTQGPIWGFGWNQVSLAQVSVAENNYPDTSYVEYSHNIILDILIWNGPLLGGLILFSIAFWAVKRSFACRQLSSWYLLLCLAAMAAHCMVEYPHAYTFFLLPVGIAAGYLESLYNKSQNIPSPRWLNTSMLIVYFLLLFVIFKEYQSLQKDYRLARFEALKIKDYDPEAKTSSVYLLSQLKNRIDLIRTRAKPNMSEDEIDLIRKTAHRYAYPPALFRYVLTLLHNNKEAQAKNELAVIKGLYGVDAYNDSINNLKIMGFKNIETPTLHTLSK